MTRTVLFSLIALMVTWIFADVNPANCMTKSDAEKAVDIIQSGMMLRKYCAPCGDSQWSYVMVKHISIVPSGIDNYLVKVNNYLTDLADLYMNINGNWVNIAILLGMDVTGSPEFLPDEYRTP